MVTMGGETESPWELSRLRKPGKVPLQWMRSRASNWALGQVLTHWGVCPPRPGLLSTGLSFLLVSTKCRLALLRTRGSLGAIG